MKADILRGLMNDAGLTAKGGMSKVAMVAALDKHYGAGAEEGKPSGNGDDGGEIENEGGEIENDGGGPPALTAEDPVQ